MAWGKLGEICGKYLKKGRPVYVEGRLQTRQWEDQQGNKRYTTEVVAQTMQMLGRPGEAGEAATGGEPAWEPRAQQGYEDVAVPAAGNADDDLPF